MGIKCKILSENDLIKRGDMYRLTPKKGCPPPTVEGWQEFSRFSSWIDQKAGKLFNHLDNFTVEVGTPYTKKKIG